MARATSQILNRYHDRPVPDLPVEKPDLIGSTRSLLARDAPLVAGPSSVKRGLIAGGVCLGIALVVLLLISRTHAPARIAPPAESLSANASPVDRQQGGGGVFVHVAGAVREPGLYELSTGARVADAIAAAGGALRKADVDVVNLAQVVTDGMKIAVPRKGVAIAGSAEASSSSTESSALVSINSAGLVELETLPGVGPVTAEAIMAHREEIGVFTSLEELLDVSGIGPATFAEIRPHVSL